MESASLLSHTYPLAHQPQQIQQQRQHLPLVPQQAQPALGNYDQQQSGGQPAITILQPASAVESNSTTTSIVGQKRNFLGNSVNSNAPDAQDGGNFVKLFVGSVPRTINEEEVRPMFAEHGNVLEVALIKDKRTGQQQGCCFVKYGTIAEAERAIRALNNQRTLPGGTAPVQVRYADGERERLGAVEHKLFVGSLNKQASEKEIQELFAPYGRVDDVYIMRDEQKQSRGCAFIKYPTREMATAAINALNGIYVMPGCDQPLAVRFADPKRPKGGDTRVGGPGFGGPGYNSRPGSVGNRLAPAPVGPMGSRGPPMGWRPMGGPGMGPQPQIGPGGYGGPFGLRGNSGNVPMGYYQQGVQRQPHPYGQPVSQQQQPYGQAAASPQQSSQQVLSMPSQPPQHLQLSQGQVTPQQLPLQQQMQPSRQLQPPQQQLQPPQQQLQPPQQQLQPQLQPQQQSQSLLQAHPQHQQQPPQQQQAAGMKPGYYPMSSIQQGQQQPQPSWVIPAPQQTVSTLAPAPAPPTSCDWTEHTSPEGYKYYHNSSTGESKWEKPEELVAFEQQQTAQVQAQTVVPTQYSGTTVIPQHLIQTLNYPQLQITNGSVDQPRQQVQPSMQEWAWKQKAAGAGNLG